MSEGPNLLAGGTEMTSVKTVKVKHVEEILFQDAVRIGAHCGGRVFLLTITRHEEKIVLMVAFVQALSLILTTYRFLGRPSS